MSLSLFSLTGKVAMVAGAGKGIGKAIALGFADAGADLVVASRTAADIEATAAEVRAKGRKALGVPADVRDSSQVASLVEKALEEFGRIDILVNNAGGPGGLVEPFLNYSEETWEAGYSQNVKTAFLCSQAVGRVMVEQGRGGSIINISSTSGRFPSAGAACYGSAKAAIIHMTGSLGVEWGKHNIRVNCIIPGATVTPGSIRVFYGPRPELREQRIKMIPLGRLAEPEDLVGAAIFLASDASAYVTGEAIRVNGGAMMLAR